MLIYSCIRHLVPKPSHAHILVPRELVIAVDPSSSLTDLHNLGGDPGPARQPGHLRGSLWASRTPWSDAYNSLTWEVYVITVERGGRRGSGLS